MRVDNRMGEYVGVRSCFDRLSTNGLQHAVVAKNAITVADGIICPKILGSSKLLLAEQ